MWLVISHLIFINCFSDVDSGILSNQVTQFNLHVEIAWLGKRLDEIVLQRAAKQQPTVFFSLMPNHLTISHNFTRVNFPNCHSSNEKFGSLCDFEVQQLSKLSWVHIQRRAPYIHHLLQHIMFTQSQYEHMIHWYGAIRSKNPKNFSQAACTWLQENEDYWKPWMPTQIRNENVLYLAGMFPMTGKYQREPGVLPGKLHYNYF